MRAITILLACISLITLGSCEKDEGKLPNIDFKTGTGFVSTDTIVDAGATITIGIEASKSEKKDPLKKFNISLSIDGGADATVYSEDLSGDDGDNYEYDFTTTVGNSVGQLNTYTFTITNRDGLVNQLSLTVMTM